MSRIGSKRWVGTAASIAAPGSMRIHTHNAPIRSSGAHVQELKDAGRQKLSACKGVSAGYGSHHMAQQV